jgi:catechol 2,3-dioxygenase-like lactoylglutathione lyase family enzyme
VAKLHHSAIVTHDVETSLVFWRDGLGLEVLMDDTFEGPWSELFGGMATKLRSVFLGETGAPDSGIVELVDLGEAAPLSIVTGGGE